MLNQIVIVGRLVKDPVTIETNDGKKLANITLAVQRNFKNSEGNYETDFIDCVLWKGIAESTSNYCSKGSVLGIKGRLVTSVFKNNEGLSRKSVEVVAEKVSFIGNSNKDVSTTE
ncbi:single-stranded DNA-binding protein [Mycoplasma sp. P36-A1]|uniref:single-stranded DNA-binding protein n=1 Tax=Mycoplasma sp. P36-A1 TaxID=3252900 RepID=UPI003C2BC604